jgi:hypothetical protein
MVIHVVNGGYLHTKESTRDENAFLSDMSIFSDFLVDACRMMEELE